MIIELAAGGFLVADFVYHRWFEDHPKDFSSFADSIDVPQTEEGTAVPYIYGKVRITRPILVWMGTPSAEIRGWGSLTGKTLYSASMFFWLGTPFADGNSDNHIHRIWQGDTEYVTANYGIDMTPYAAGASLEQLDGNGEFEDLNRHLARVAFMSKTTEGDITAYSSGFVEFLNGNPSQIMVDEGSLYTAHTRAAYQIGVGSVDPVAVHSEMPGYRGLLSVCLYDIKLSGDPIGSVKTLGGFTWGITPQIGAISVEASSYKADGSYPAVGVMARLGEDSNPINVLYDILVSKRKLGVPASLIDNDSFAVAAATCYQEDLGFSACFDRRMPARDMVKEVLRHVDGLFFEHTKTGRLKVKLIRADYDYASLRELNRFNCKLQTISIGGMTDVPNKVDVVFKNRARGYIDDTKSAHNLANAVGQDGAERAEQRAYIGCTYEQQASALAARDLAFLSRSIIKCRVLADRSFLDVEPGDALRFTYTNPDISGLVFRVAGPPYHGKLTDGAIALDLIQDPNYQYRALPPRPPIDHPDIGRGIVVGFGTR